MGFRDWYVLKHLGMKEMGKIQENVQFGEVVIFDEDFLFWTRLFHLLQFFNCNDGR